MTIVREGAQLFVHSPTELTDDLRRQLDAIGHVTWIVAPNRLHYVWLTSWARTFSEAAVFVAPKVARKVTLASPMSEMRESGGYPWDKFIRTLPITSAYMTEVEFFHIPSRTLILTDLIESFEPAKLSSATMRWITRAAGAVAPRGGMPIDMRLTFLGRRAQLRAAVVQLIEWNPARVVIAHGKWFENNGRAALERAFRWLLPKAAS